jgi:hypothetical protein
VNILAPKLNSIDRSLPIDAEAAFVSVDDVESRE